MRIMSVRIFVAQERVFRSMMKFNYNAINVPCDLDVHDNSSIPSGPGQNQLQMISNLQNPSHSLLLVQLFSPSGSLIFTLVLELLSLLQGLVDRVRLVFGGRIYLRSTLRVDV